MQRENGVQLTCLEILRARPPLPPSGEPISGTMPCDIEPATHWAQQAAASDWISPLLPPRASPGTSKLLQRRLCRAGSEQECLEGGKKAGGRKQPHCHPPNYWLGWQGRRRKADIVYLIKSKQQFAAASLPLAVCRALRAGDLAFDAPTEPGSCHHTPNLRSPEPCTLL